MGNGAGVDGHDPCCDSRGKITNRSGTKPFMLMRGTTKGKRRRSLWRMCLLCNYRSPKRREYQGQHEGTRRHSLMRKNISNTLFYEASRRPTPGSFCRADIFHLWPVPRLFKQKSRSDSYNVGVPAHVMGAVRGLALRGDPFRLYDCQFTIYRHLKW